MRVNIAMCLLLLRPRIAYLVPTLAPPGKVSRTFDGHYEHVSLFVYLRIVTCDGLPTCCSGSAKLTSREMSL